jgi:sigma-B regulation protein RsbU (phosphoserine phosphatase)
MNRLLHVSTEASSFASFFYAQFDEQTGRLTYVNAGHNPPILVRAAASAKALGVGYGGDLHEPDSLEEGRAEVRLLTKGGPIIGAFSDCTYEQETINLQTGDLLVAYTDGVTEARNVDDQEFGEARLNKIVGSSAHNSARELSERIVESVRQWCGDVPPHDDLTLVVMKVK